MTLWQALIFIEVKQGKEGSFKKINSSILSSEEKEYEDKKVEARKEVLLLLYSSRYGNV